MSDKSTIYGNILRINHFILSVFLAVFFIYAGVKKFIPKAPSAKQVSNEEFIKAFQDNKLESPLTFRLAIKALKAADFLKMVGVLQILSGILILLPATRLIGLLMLLPITVNVFCFHFFMDNRPDENLETGFLFALNILLLVYYYKRLSLLTIRDWSLSFTKKA